MSSEFDDLRNAVAGLTIDGWRPDGQDVTRAMFGVPDIRGFERESVDGSRRVGIYLEESTSIWVDFVLDYKTEAAIEIPLDGSVDDLILEIVTNLMQGKFAVHSRLFGRMRLDFESPHLRGIRFDVGHQ